MVLPRASVDRVIGVERLESAVLPWNTRDAAGNGGTGRQPTQRTRWAPTRSSRRDGPPAAAAASGGSARLQALLTHMRRDQLRSPQRLPPLSSQRAPTPVASSAGAVISASSFTPVPQHFKLPHGIFMREATAVGVDSEDNVYVFNRGNVPVLVFDPSGNLIDQWGNPTPYDGTEEVADPTFELFGPGFKLSRWRGSEFMRPHAIFVDHEDNLWLVDDLANLITKCDRAGNRLMILAPEGRVLRTKDEMDGVLGKVVACPPAQSGRMFNRPTDVTVEPLSGDIYITDGYGNSVVHQLRADGSHIRSWGSPGTDAGQFNCTSPSAQAVEA